MPQGTSAFEAQLVEVLKKRGISQPAIDRFAHHLALRPAGSDLICPTCFLQGREGVLVVQTKISQIVAMRCNVCGDQVLLRTPD